MPTLPPDADPFLAAIAETPDDPEPRLVFADWLEERGLPGAAAASRWLAAGHLPQEFPDYSLPWTWFVFSEKTLAFWRSNSRKNDRVGMLPEGLAIPPLVGGTFGSTEAVSDGFFDFATRADAERSLLEAWPDRPGVPGLLRVRSGGQTGVDRAGLDAAMEAGLPVGGFAPRGRIAEDGRVPDRYPLIELRRGGYPARTKANVAAADATLVLTVGKPTGGTLLTVKHARSIGRPVLVVDLDVPVDVDEVAAWVRAHAPRELNVAGPREGEDSGIGARAKTVLDAVFARIVTSCTAART